MSDEYEAVVSRDGRYWMIAIPALGGLTQARTFAEVEDMAREYVAVVEDVDVDDVRVRIRLERVGEISGVADRLVEWDELQDVARRAERDAATYRQTLARELAAQHVTVRDIGAILHVSHQRAHQLVKGHA